jgi:hypothetical protein
MTTCDYCSKTASFIQYDCCALESTVCSDCVEHSGQTKHCEWYVMGLDRVVIASSDPADIGETY